MDEKLRVMKGNKDVSDDWTPFENLRVLSGGKDETKFYSLFVIFLVLAVTIMAMLLGVIIGGFKQSMDDQQILQEAKLAKLEAANVGTGYCPQWASSTDAGKRLFSEWKICDERGGTNVVYCDIR